MTPVLLTEMPECELCEHNYISADRNEVFYRLSDCVVVCKRCMGELQDEGTAIVIGGGPLSESDNGVQVKCHDCGVEVLLPFSDDHKLSVLIWEVEGWTAPPPRCPECSAANIDEVG